MEEIQEDDRGLFAASMSALDKFPVIMLQFPEVFALMAPPNKEGVEALNRAKKRLPEKYYSSLVGKDSSFFRLTGPLPYYLPEQNARLLLEGAIVRIRMGEENQDSSLCCRGTHQGLLYRNGHLRQLFSAMEEAFLPLVNLDFYFGKSYSAALCTSANISGKQESITDLNTARDFGNNAGIPLLIRSDGISSGKGSYPVLILEDNHIAIEREGPGLESIIQRFPENLFIRR